MRIIHKMLFGIALLVPMAAQGEEITGHACYRYSDNESLNAAREIALSLAKRDALEGYAVFVESTSTVENMALKNDLIASLSGGILRNIKIIERREDLVGREICRSIQAEIEPVEAKNRIDLSIMALTRKKSQFDTGLPENSEIKVLKIDEITCEFVQLIEQGYKAGAIIALGTSSIRCLRIVAECKVGNKPIYSNFSPIRIIFHDDQGIPDISFSPEGFCSGRVGDIINILAPYNDQTYTIELTR